jgi:hypothetical protein
MGDVFAAIAGCIAELEPLAPEERGQVVGALMAAMGTGITVTLGTPDTYPTPLSAERYEARKPCPVPVRHVDGRSREARRSEASAPPKGRERKLGQPYEKNRAAFNRVLSILLRHPSGINATELKHQAVVTESEWAAAKKAAVAQKLATVTGHGAGAKWTPCARPE